MTLASLYMVIIYVIVFKHLKHYDIINVIVREVVVQPPKIEEVHFCCRIDRDSNERSKVHCT